MLVAEDNTVNQKLIRRILENMGCQVILAQNGKEAVELFQQREFDLILMDMQMPVMGGEEAVSLIRGLQSEGRIPIVALTAHAMSGDREKYLAQGMDGYVSKPINRQELFSTMSELLQQK